MTGRSQTARELAALQEEMSASKGRRRPPTAHRDVTGDEEAQADAEDVAAEEPAAAAEDGDFLNMVREFIAEAEHNVAEHPAASVIGALLVGILIGRVLGKR